MKKLSVVLVVVMMAVSASAAVRLIVEDMDGMAAIKYETDGELVRAFALDVTTDAGTFVAVRDFHRGESTEEKPGYGIFPSAFAAAIEVDAETGEVVDWDVNDYTPVADPCDAPEDTLPGLGTYGVTLEMGALYSPPEDDSPNAPGIEGLLCRLAVSDIATVSVKLNKIRGGVVLTDPTVEAEIDLERAKATINPVASQ
jgi:hypothetical protein